jgi:hypothetical protein
MNAFSYFPNPVSCLFCHDIWFYFNPEEEQMERLIYEFYLWIVDDDDDDNNVH